MQRKTKFCVQVHYVMESICINKHMFAQRNLQLTRIELWITKNSQKNGRKFRENWNKVLIVSDDVGWNFQSPGMTSKYGNLTKNTQIKSEKTSEKNTNGLENVSYLNPFISSLVGQRLSNPFHSKHIFNGKMAVVHTEILQEPYSTYSLRNSIQRRAGEVKSTQRIPRTLCSVRCFCPKNYESSEFPKRDLFITLDLGL